MDTFIKQIHITQEGLDALRSELDELVNIKRPAAVARLENARQEGDLSENSDYANGKEELEFLDGRIDELTHVIAHAVVVEEQNGKKGAVGLGATVTVSIDGSKHDYEIVGNWEADPMNKKISYESPLGQALVGKKVGDQVEVEAPAGTISYKILAVV
jgi:transcription elongation factor GreA